MPYTPVELRHVKIARALFGYKRAEAERLLEDVADSFEDVWRDRGELADKVEDLEKELAEHKQREHLLTQTLVAAPATDGRANDALIRFLSSTLDVPTAQVQIVSGHTSRDKIISLAGVDADEVQRRLAAASANPQGE